MPWRHVRNITVWLCDVGVGGLTLDDGQEDDDDEEEEADVEEDAVDFVGIAIWWLNLVTNSAASAHALVQVKDEALQETGEWVTLMTSYASKNRGHTMVIPLRMFVV